METCRAIRQQDNDHKHQLPVVMIASQEAQAPGAAAGVTDWLIKPFTDAYARTKIRAALGSTPCVCPTTPPSGRTGKGVAPRASKGNRR